MELIEVAVHVIKHGDLAHADSHEEDEAPLGADEHGCSGTFHLCPCHHGSAATTPAIVVSLQTFDSSRLVAIFAPLDRTGEVTEAPPIRPPIV